MYSSYSIHLLVLTTAQYSCKISVMHRACAVLIFILFKSERETNTDVAYQELGQETPSWNMDVPSGDLATVPNAHVPCLRGAYPFMVAPLCASDTLLPPHTFSFSGSRTDV